MGHVPSLPCSQRGLPTVTALSQPLPKQGSRTTLVRMLVMTSVAVRATD